MLLLLLMCIVLVLAATAPVVLVVAMMHGGTCTVHDAMLLSAEGRMVSDIELSAASLIGRLTK